VDHRHGPVPARPDRPVPRRLPARVSAARVCDVVVVGPDRRHGRAPSSSRAAAPR
jgi:hypothetical protein